MASFLLAKNFITGREYIHNSLELSKAAQGRPNLWAGYKQACSAGFTLKHGAEPVLISIVCAGISQPVYNREDFIETPIEEL